LSLETFLLTFSFFFFIDLELEDFGNLELTPKSPGKGKVKVVELLYYIRTFTNVIFSFVWRFWTWRLGINA